MKIQIKPLLEGAESAEGIAVIIDVINASSTIVECLQRGAKEVVPVKTMKEAAKIKKAGDFICGEMKNFRIQPDFYNSPYSASKEKLIGRRVIIKTEAGTKGILGAKKAEEVIIGCFLNCSAIVRYLEKKKPNIVSIVPMGDYGKTKNIEDEAFATYLKNKLDGKYVDDFKEIRSKIKTGSTRNLFRSTFLRRQMNSCMRMDTSDIVPKFVGNKVMAIKV